MKLIVQFQVEIDAPDYNNQQMNPELINKLNLIEKEIFSDYIIDSNLEALINENVKSGILTLEYRPITQEYFAIIEYDVERQLNPKAESELIEYTLGQLSDGIGENLVQMFAWKYSSEVFLEADNSGISITYR